MNKIAYLGLGLLLSTGVVAGEVGAPYPEEARNLAVAEIGASSSWATEPYDDEASAHQIAELNSRVNEINEQMKLELETLIVKKIDSTLDQ